jgi:AraC-like DNA-binding protein
MCVIALQARTNLAWDGDVARGTGHQVGVSPTGEVRYQGPCGLSAFPWDHPLQAGPIGVTGGTAANALAQAADVVVAVGSRLQDFTTGSHSLFPQAKLVAINVNAFDALKWRASAVLGDVASALDALATRLAGWTSGRAWQDKAIRDAQAWRDTVTRITGVREVAPPALPYEGEVIGAVQRSATNSAANGRAPPPCPAWLRAARERLVERLADPPSLGELARAGYPSVHLAQTFARRYGMPMRRFIRMHRVFRALGLVERRPLAAIAADVGFADRAT